MAVKNKNKFKIPGELREMAAAAKCRNPVWVNAPRNRARKAEKTRRQGERSSEGTTMQRPIVQPVWVNGKATED